MNTTDVITAVTNAVAVVVVVVTVVIAAVRKRGDSRGGAHDGGGTLTLTRQSVFVLAVETRAPVKAGEGHKRRDGNRRGGEGHRDMHIEPATVTAVVVVIDVVVTTVAVAVVAYVVIAVRI